MTAGPSSETMWVRDIFKVQKQKCCQPRILYPEEMSFKNKSKIKFLYINLEESIANGTALWEMFKDVFQEEGKRFQVEI